MLPKKLKNFTAFVDGRGYVGRVTEVEVPKLALKMEEYRAGGMDAAVEIETGMEKLESSLTFAEYDEEIYKMFGLVDGNAVSLTLRGARQNDQGTDEVIINLRGGYKELDSGTWKAGDDATLKASVALRYYKLTIAGKELIEIDVENMVRKINGKDQLADQRKALGL
ncbi:phage major tail tube protein [Desulfoluna limicola]|uniref:Phage major tail tube protein n=1 Tax=Desulfoluna limicola TaxID=2810562 RepID=A0ABN6EYA4_9BACT|nr:phage major tail tube protein [Desulfoluna limicola]BCS94623.1 phage major tail tube protein [Desulfoluna limicola]